MTGLLEGWSAARSDSNDVAGVEVSKMPPGFRLEDAAIDEIQEQQGRQMMAQWDEQSRAAAIEWDEGSSYPPPNPPVNTGSDSTYADIPEQR